jgi:hypothetical protein
MMDPIGHRFCNFDFVGQEQHLHLPRLMWEGGEEKKVVLDNFWYDLRTQYKYDTKKLGLSLL